MTDNAVLINSNKTNTPVVINSEKYIDKEQYISGNSF